MPQFAVLTAFQTGIGASQGWIAMFRPPIVEVRTMVLGRIVRVVVNPALVMLLSLAAAAGQRPRTVRGKVTDMNGIALKGAVVQIKNTQSLRIRSYISQDDGSYRFLGLSPDVDYEVSAAYRGRLSSTETVSRFDSKEVVEVDPVIPTSSRDQRTT